MNKIAKLILGILGLSFAACNTSNKPLESDGEIVVMSKVIYPKYRVWTTPSGGEEPGFNPPCFEWPTGRKGKYDVRISSSKDFSENRIEKSNIPFAMFNPHQKELK